MKEGKKLGEGVLDQDGTAYIPLKAAMTALGGKAEDDGKGAWNVTCGESTATVDADDGKTKVDGKRASGNGFSTYTDQDKNRFYVSPQVLAAILGKTYTDLGDGGFSFTGVTLDGFDSQKAYLKNMKDKLGDAVDGDIPEADVYIALTFDDGPTGKKDGYPNGLTNYLLDGLKQRGAVATFLMVGERVSEVSDVLPRMVNEGHELGNHTMNHPMCHLTGLGTDDIRSQIDDATNAVKDIAGQAPQVLRPVGGGVNSDVKAVAAELNYPIINWSVDTEDWNYRDADHVKKVIVEELNAAAKKYGEPRRTSIVYPHEITSYTPEEEQKEEYPVTVFLSREGYFKKITPASLRMNSEQKFKEGDVLRQSFETTSNAEAMFFTDHCQVYKTRLGEFDDAKASVLGDYLPTKLKMDAGENVIFMVLPGADYAGSLLFFYENGKVARIEMKAYQTASNRRKLTGAYSDKSPLACIRRLDEDCELAVYSNEPRCLIFHTALLAPKTTRSAQGVAVMTLKPKYHLETVLLSEETSITNRTRYRVRAIPAAGALVKEEDSEDQQISLL